MAAYSYMALVPIIQPPVIRVLTTSEERRIKMSVSGAKPVSRTVKVLFPIVITLIAGFIAPISLALVGSCLLYTSTCAQEAVACARQGCILVVPSVDKSFIPALERASALIIEQGGLTSDGAIFALQLGIPAVVGASGATSVLNSGDVVTVDAIRGLVYAGVAKVK